jgi:hypothetical protein
MVHQVTVAKERTRTHSRNRPVSNRLRDPGGNRPEVHEFGYRSICNSSAILQNQLLYCQQHRPLKQPTMEVATVGTVRIKLKCVQIF